MIRHHSVKWNSGNQRGIVRVGSDTRHQGAVGRLAQAHAGVVGRNQPVTQRCQSRLEQGDGKAAGQGPVLEDPAA